MRIEAKTGTGTMKAGRQTALRNAASMSTVTTLTDYLMGRGTDPVERVQSTAKDFEYLQSIEKAIDAGF